MSSKYKVYDDASPHFITFTVVGWIDVFTRDLYKDIFIKSLTYCVQNKGLCLHAWVIMTNHVHLIVSTQEHKLEWIVRDIKKFTSKKIVSAIEENESESRKEWMMNMFKYIGTGNCRNKQYQFWKNDYHPVELSSDFMMNQKLDYLHENPVRSSLVWEPWHYKYSSAIDYYTKEKGLISVDLI
jgi:REP element-mobilizing transposase RayT